ncbi:MAG: hypothetical protein M3P93_14535 [Actinomycetota bacterium]|nr:hypothetical protein [Actinomycetota bacterium]
MGKAPIRRVNHYRSLSHAGTSVEPRVSVVRAGSRGKHADRFQALGLVAIGFNPIADVRGMTREQIASTVRNRLGGGAAGAIGQVYRFANDIQVGDLVIVPLGETRQLFYGRVVGDYEY